MIYREVRYKNKGSKLFKEVIGNSDRNSMERRSIDFYFTNDVFLSFLDIFSPYLLILL